MLDANILLVPHITHHHKSPLVYHSPSYHYYYYPARQTQDPKKEVSHMVMVVMVMMPEKADSDGGVYHFQDLVHISPTQEERAGQDGGHE